MNNLNLKAISLYIKTESSDNYLFLETDLWVTEFIKNVHDSMHEEILHISDWKICTVPASFQQEASIEFYEYLSKLEG